MSDEKNSQNSTSDNPAAETATMFFDPVCPWAWMTSRWLMQVEQVRNVKIDWQVMSLSVLNEGRDLPDDYQALMKLAWLPVRVVVAAQQRCGQSAVKPLYDALGNRFHPGEADKRDKNSVLKVIKEALAECDLPADLIDAAEPVKGDDIDKALRQNNERVVSLVGGDVGTPVVAFGDTAFFGPVVTPAPKGEQAGKLWDGCLLVAGTPGFYEIKRTRTASPDFS